MLREQYVTAGELAQRLAVSAEHLRWLARSGKIPPGERLGKDRFYSRAEADDIAAWYGHYRAARDGMAWKQSGHGVAPTS
jgi:DNA-binding transcriptional MerR regulator